MKCVYSSVLPSGAKLKYKDYLIIGVDNQDESGNVCKSEHRRASERRIFDKRPETAIAELFKKPRLEPI